MTRLTVVLLTTTLLIGAAGAHGQAQAQNQDRYFPEDRVEFSGGALADLRLEDIPPEQIASDVRSEFNPRTGRQEFVAPTFDPFAEDDALAADVTLRSTSNARDLNDVLMQDGALLDIAFFYSRKGEAEFGRTQDALYLSGEPVPIVSRDRRDLECSSRVTETVYLADRYYGGFSGYRGLTHYGLSHHGLSHRGRRWAGPRYFSGFYNDYWGPHYRAGFGRGFGYDRGFRGRGHYGYRPVNPRPHPRRRPGRVGDGPDDRPRPAPPIRPRVYDTERFRSSDDSGRGRPRTRRQDYIRDSVPRKPRRRVAPQPEARRENFSPTPERPNRRTPPSGAMPHVVDQGAERRRRTSPERRRTDRVRPERRRTDRVRPERPRTEGPRTERPMTDRLRTDRPNRDRSRADRGRQERSRPERSRLDRAKPKRAPRETAAPRRSDRPAPARREIARSAPKPRSEPRPAPARQARPKVERQPARATRRDTSSNNRKRLEMFPHTHASDDVVVVSASRDCAVEESLTLFIPNERLDAARFDGLTIWVRDIASTGQGDTLVYEERPLFIPPNYIEGFRRAVTQ